MSSSVINRISGSPFPGLAGQRLVKNPVKTSNRLWEYSAAAFCLGHIPLALLLYQVNVLATLHALVTFGLGIWWAISAPRRPIKVACVGAYITGAEVLWRMTNAQIFWESGKYAVASIFLVAILRSGRLKGPLLVFGYFALLLPSTAVIIERLGPAKAQAYISFNLSGPLAMMMAAWFFSQLKLSVEQTQRIFLMAAGPIIGIASVTFFAVYTAKKLSFTGESNYVSSGGFGPNQVSAALGLGALFALMFVLIGKSSVALKLLMLGAMLLMAVQSALTFSRGGLYNFAGGAVLAGIYLLRDARTRRNLLCVAVIVFLLGSYVILPRLENLTGGTLGSRFSNTNTTNRLQIIVEELRIWQKYPILGVGPGGSKFVGSSTAHTEFARLPAEHGTFGVVALLLMLLAAARSIRKAKTLKGKASAVCMIGWSFLFMLSAAMRLVAPAFTFGLASATFLPEQTTDSVSSPARLRRVRHPLSRSLPQARSFASQHPGANSG